MAGQNYCVVGGSKGIGLAIVERLAASGHSVTVLSRTVGDLSNLGGAIRHVPHDVTQNDVPLEAIPESLNGLVYCPGSINLRAFNSLKPEAFREDFELNVVGAVRALQACAKSLKAGATASGTTSSTVLFSTVAVQQGMFAHASIACSKGAVEGLTRTLAAEWSPDVRVNCLAPALTETSLTERFFSTPEKAEALAKNYPLARTGKPEDLASIASYLLSDASGWITGQVIGVDGGMSSVRK